MCWEYHSNWRGRREGEGGEGEGGEEEEGRGEEGGKEERGERRERGGRKERRRREWNGGGIFDKHLLEPSFTLVTAVHKNS